MQIVAHMGAVGLNAAIVQIHRDRAKMVRQLPDIFIHCGGLAGGIHSGQQCKAIHLCLRIPLSDLMQDNGISLHAGCRFRICIAGFRLDNQRIKGNVFIAA